MTPKTNKRWLTIIFLLCFLSACTNSHEPLAPDRFSFAPYATQQKSMRELEGHLHKLESRAAIEGLLVSQGGARLEVLGDGKIFYVYEHASPLWSWAIITHVKYSTSDVPYWHTTGKYSIPLLTSPEENLPRFRVEPWVKYGAGYGTEKLNLILAKMFPPESSCADAEKDLRKSGELHKKISRPAKDVNLTYTTLYNETILMLVGWEYGVSFACDAKGALRAPPRAFIRYTGI